MKKLYLVLVLMSFVADGIGQEIKFNEIQRIFTHPYQLKAEFDFPVLTVDLDDDGVHEFIAGDFSSTYLIAKDTAGVYNWKKIAQNKCVPLTSADINGDDKTDVIFDKWIGIQESIDELVVMDLDLASLEFIIGVDDYNNDGNNDLITQAITSSNPNQIVLYSNDGLGQFEKDTLYSAESLDIVVAKDIDGDGDLDFVYKDDEELKLNVLINGGDYNFEIISFYFFGSEVDNFFIEDVDSDGDEDLLINFFGRSNTFFLENNDNFVGYNGLNIISEIKSIAPCQGIPKVDDINGDGVNDVLIAGMKFSVQLGVYEYGLYLLEGNNQGGFYPIRTVYSKMNTQTITNDTYVKNYYSTNVLSFIDENEDGMLDVIFADPFNSAYSTYFLENNSLETNTNQIELPSFSIAPNPSITQLQIMGVELTQNSRYKIFNTMGQVVQNGEIMEGAISTHSLPVGNYILELNGIQNQQSVLRSKFVKI